MRVPTDVDVTLEQARALDALARTGTFVAAGKALGKRHTAVLYAIAGLEAQTGLTLLDRTGYRTRLTPAGESVLVACRRMLAAAEDVARACEAIRDGWEPSLRVVFDGVYPVLPILERLASLGAPRTTRVEVFAEFLSGVEATFHRLSADVMISVLPPEAPGLVATPLAPVSALLVAHAKHPLGAGKRVTLAEVARHVLVTVRGSDSRLLMSTAALDQQTTIHLNDFHAKKTAILAGMGFGWIPDYLLEPELSAGTLRRVLWPRTSAHVFRPHVYQREGSTPGRAAAALVEGLVALSPHG